MSGLERYLAVIRKLQNQTALRLTVSQNPGRLLISGIEFIPASVPQLFKPELRGKGVLVHDLTRDEAAYCKSNGISFLTAKGELFLLKSGYRILLEPKAPHRRDPQLKKPKPASPFALPPPTVLISPNGLAILDTLFRLNEDELRPFRSALSFVQKFRLNQSKISQMMTHLRARTPVELKQAIQKLPEDWWRTSLRYPMTRKGLTPFFEAAKPYHSLRAASSADAAKSLQKWEQAHATQLVPGPVEVMRGLGLIRDGDTYFWGSPSTFHELKREFQLIPGPGTGSGAGTGTAGAATWHLAVASAGLERESILSPLAADPRPAAVRGRSNTFRAIWDLTFGDERLREIQASALQKILHGV